MAKKTKNTTRDSAETLIERDLTALAQGGKLPEGYGLDQSAAMSTHPCSRAAWRTPTS